MTREIKYQALDLGWPQRCYLESVNVFKDEWIRYEQDEDDPIIWWETPIKLSEYDSKAVEKFIFRQYTGLKDCNGKEIYEGDIYKCNTSEYLFIVKWSDKFSMFMLEYQSSFKNSQPLGCRNLSYGEVIGNIHDNPELLEGTTP